MSSDGMPRTRSSVSARSRGVRPDHFGHVQVVASRARCGAARLALRAFALQVEFGGQRVLDLGHDLARADLVGGRMRAVDQRGERLAAARCRRRSACSMSGAQHLDHDFARRRVAVGRQRRRMHLRDRGRGQRRGVEARERVGDRPAQRLLDRCARAAVAVERRDAVLQQRQFVGDVGRHQVAARRQDLPELDEDRPELLQRQAQARAARLRRDLAPRRAARTAAAAAASVRPACRRAGRRGGSAAARGRCARRAGTGVMRAPPRGCRRRDARGEAFDVVAQRVDVVVEGIELGARRPRRAIPR